MLSNHALSKALENFDNNKDLNQYPYEENGESYIIVKVPDTKPVEYFAYEKIPFAVGGQGVVHRAYPITQSEEKICINKKDEFVAKLVPKIVAENDVEEIEEECLKKFYRGKKAVNLGAQSCLIYEFIPGRNLNDRLAVSAAVNDLPFETKVKIILELVQWVDKLHKLGIVHRDIKLSNIRIFIKKQKKGEVKTYLFDFGIAKKVSLNPDELFLSDKIGSVAVAPELLENGQIGLKSDMYSLAAVLLSVLLEAYDPLYELLGQRTYIPQSFALAIEKRSGYPVKPWQKPYDLCFDTTDESFKRSNKNNTVLIDNFEINLRKTLEKLISRMIASDHIRPLRSTYKDRPPSDELVIFFDTLDKCLEEKEIEKKHEYCAKLVLISVGAWHSGLKDWDWSKHQALTADILQRAKQQEKISKRLGIAFEQEAAIEKQAYCNLVNTMLSSESEVKEHKGEEELKSDEAVEFKKAPNIKRLQEIYEKNIKAYRKQSKGWTRSAAIANIDRLFSNDQKLDITTPLLLRKTVDIHFLAGCLAYEAKKANSRHFNQLFRKSSYSRCANALDSTVEEWLKEQLGEEHWQCMPYPELQARKEILIETYLAFKNNKMVPSDSLSRESKSSCSL